MKHNGIFFSKSKLWSLLESERKIFQGLLKRHKLLANEHAVIGAANDPIINHCQLLDDIRYTDLLDCL